ncbi:MAG TPA: TetR/AcrR family transcriptional regulator [bacterium]
MTNRDNKYLRILHAAGVIFAKKGFFYARVTDIAREADVADGTIYIYFKNKDDILIHLFEEIMKTFISKAKEEIGNMDSPQDKLRRFIELHFQMSQKNPHVAEVITLELRQSNKFMKEYKNVWFKEYLDVISSIIHEGQDKGMFRNNIHPGIVKRALFGALDELTLHWSLSKKYSLDECQKEIETLFLNGLKKT